MAAGTQTDVRNRMHNLVVEKVQGTRSVEQKFETRRNRLAAEAAEKALQSDPEYLNLVEIERGARRKIQLGRIRKSKSQGAKKSLQRRLAETRVNINAANAEVTAGTEEQSRVSKLMKTMLEQKIAEILNATVE